DEHQTADNGSNHPTDHLLLRIAVTGFYGQHHRYRTHDEDKGHDPYKYQRIAVVRYKRNGLEDLVWAHPSHVGKPLRAIVDQKRRKRKRMGGKEKPHHDFAVLHIERRSSTVPSSGFYLI